LTEQGREINYKEKSKHEKENEKIKKYEKMWYLGEKQNKGGKFN